VKERKLSGELHNNSLLKREEEGPSPASKRRNRNGKENGKKVFT